MAYQIDAYFSMLGIFESIKREDLTDSPLDFLINWLLEIQRSNELNIRVMDNIPQKLTPKEKESVEKLKGYILAVNERIGVELNKINLIKKSVKSKRRK